MQVDNAVASVFLPPHLVAMILAYLASAAGDVARCAGVAKACREASNNVDLWRKVRRMCVLAGSGVDGGGRASSFISPGPSRRRRPRRPRPRPRRRPRRPRPRPRPPAPPPTPILASPSGYAAPAPGPGPAPGAPAPLYSRECQRLRRSPAVHNRDAVQVCRSDAHNAPISKE